VTPRPPDSTGNLSSAETNPLPHVSSAKAWTAISKPPSRPLITLPKAAPIIKEKLTPPRRVRADGTQEICADDIMVIVPQLAGPTKQPSADEIAEDDILVEVTEPAPFRAPAYSVHATQEILGEDVLEVQHVANQLAHQPVVMQQKDERPSTVPPPWTVDTGDDLEFPTPPKYSGQYPAYSTGPRITNFSATQVFRRRSANVKIVVGSLAAALAVVTIAGLARFAPSSAFAASSDGPVGIAMHAPKKLDKSVRAKALAYGKAPKMQEAEVVSIDALPTVPTHHYRRR
jgi:hypothetical protein